MEFIETSLSTFTDWLTMRQRAAWMKSKDDIILETLGHTDAALTPRGIELNSHIHVPPGVSDTTIYARLDDLLAGGLVKRCDRNESFIQITADGRAYLRGELRPPDLDEDDEE